jgi:hypothetical protein
MRKFNFLIAHPHISKQRTACSSASLSHILHIPKRDRTPKPQKSDTFGALRYALPPHPKRDRTPKPQNSELTSQRLRYRTPKTPKERSHPLNPKKRSHFLNQCHNFTIFFLMTLQSIPNINFLLKI